MDPFVLFIIFCVGVLASFIGAIVGGGGLINIPVLVFLGLNPVVAIATNRFAGLGLATGAGIKYWKEKKIVARFILPICVLRLIGASVGSVTVITMDPQLLNTIIGVALLALGFIIFKKKEIGIKQGKQQWIVWPLLLLTGFWGGFFSGGVGILNLFVITTFLGLTMMEANGTSVLAGYPARLMTIAIFAYAGVIDYTVGVVLLVGMTIGGWLGASTAVKKGNEWVRLLFLGLIAVSAVKFLFFP